MLRWLNAILDKYLDLIKGMNKLHICHVPRLENSRANDLAQQASGYNISKGRFLIIKKPMFEVLELEDSAISGSKHDSVKSFDWRSPRIS